MSTFLSHIRSIVHTHSQYVSALTAMKNFKLKMVHQNSCRFYENLSYDPNYEGIATSQSDEGKRIATLLGSCEVMLQVEENSAKIVTY